MTRQHLVEQIRRQIYNGQPSDDAEITEGLVNRYIEEGIAVAAKQNYKENGAIEAVAYINNGFYTTFKGIAVTKDENFLWKVTLPQIPLGIGYSEGVSTMVFKDSSGQVGIPVVWLSENQKSFIDSMRPVPNKILAYQEGIFVYAKSTILLSAYTVSVTMVSGGDATNLTSTLNVPPDYVPTIIEFVKAQLAFEKAQKQDLANDGRDD